MDLSTLRTRAKTRFQDPDGHIYSDDEWDAYLNDAYMDVIDAHAAWPFLETRQTLVVVAAGTGSVALEDDAWRVTSVYNDTDHYPLEPIYGQVDYRHFYPDPDNGSGSPINYRLQANNIEVYPRPAADTTLIVDTYVPPAELVADADVPVIPPKYHRSLVYGALAYAYEDDGNPTQAGALRAAGDRLIGGLINEMDSSRSEGYPTIQDVW